MPGGDGAGGGGVMGQHRIGPRALMWAAECPDGVAQCQVRIERQLRHGGQALARVGMVERVRRGQRVPGRAGGERVAPVGQPALTGMDFLAAAEQAHDNGRARVPGHGVEHMQRLGLRQRVRGGVGFGDGIGAGPAALGFVDDQHALAGRGRGSDAPVTKGRQGLNDRVHPLLRGAASHSGGTPVGARVTHQCAAQHVHQGRIAGQEGGTQTRGERDVQPADGLARAGCAGHEYDLFAPGCQRVVHRAQDGAACTPHPVRSGGTLGEGEHVVPRIE